MEKKQEEKRKKKRQHKTMDKKVVKQNARSIEALGEGEKKNEPTERQFSEYTAVLYKKTTCKVEPVHKKKMM